MRSKLAVVVPCILAVTLLGVSAPVVSGSSRESALFSVSGFSANSEHWISLLTPDFSGCIGGTVDYPSNTVFFVSHGWGDYPFNTDPMKASFMSEATRFTFLIDGQVQMQTRVYQNNYFGIPGLMVKLFNSEYDSGLSGSHLFTGQFYLDASLFGGSFGEPTLVNECNTTVNFTA